MTTRSANELSALAAKHPELAEVIDPLQQAYDMIADSFSQGGHLLLCGNGGSAADCEHIAGELLKGYLLKRPIPAADRLAMLTAALSQTADSQTPGQDHSGDSSASTAAPASSDAYLEDVLDRLQLGLPAISLVSQAAISSAIANDQGADLVFAQQVLALGRPGDIIMGISTSGNAANVCLAIQIGRLLGLKTIALTGAAGGRAAALADLAIRVPATRTPDVQELHLPVYHTLCAMLEQHFFLPDA